MYLNLSKSIQSAAGLKALKPVFNADHQGVNPNFLFKIV